MNMERVKPWLHHQNAWCTLWCNAEKVFNYIWEISLDEQHWLHKVSEEIWNKQDKTLYLQLTCARAVLWVTQLLPNHQGPTVRQDHRSNMAWPMQEFWNAFQQGLFCTLQYSQQWVSESWGHFSQWNPVEIGIFQLAGPCQEYMLFVPRNTWQHCTE